MAEELVQNQKPYHEGNIGRHEDSSRVRWFLQGQTKSTGPVEEYEIDAAPLRVGRGTSVNLRINRPSISTLHAELAVRGSALRLRDLSSTNGTYVNGTRIHDERELREGDLVHFADAPFRVHRREAASTDIRATEQLDAFDTALALVQFDSMISQRAITAHFQPIVAVSHKAVVAYEVLARSKFPGLDTPAAMFRAAAQLNQENALSELMREIGVEQSRTIEGNPLLFLNTHPAEIGTHHLVESLRRLREQFPSVPLVLEVHESAVLQGSLLEDLRSELAELNIGLAYDDFGVGESRLAQLARAAPDFIKFDIALIRDVHLAPPPQRQLLRTLIKLVHDCGARSLAEGVEREEEHEVLAELGFELAQGFFYGRGAAPGHLTAASKTSNQDAGK